MVFVQIAWRNIVQARRRTFFLGLAMCLVTALLVLLMALSLGISDTLVRSATTLSTGHVNVAGFYKSKPSDADPIIQNASKLRALVEANTPGVDYVIDRARGWARIISASSSLNSGLTGIDIREEHRLAATLRLATEAEYKEQGRPKVVGNLNDLTGDDTLVIFAAQAKRLGVGVGDGLTVTVETRSGARNTGEFKIVAVAKDIGFMSNFSMFATKEGIRKLYLRDDDVSGAVQVYLADYGRASEVMGQLRTTLDAAGYTLLEHDPRPFFAKFDNVAGEEWTGQRLDLTIWSDEVSFLLWILTVVDWVSFTLVGILLLIIAVGIMNSMWMSVRDRTNEVGTLRAIGMSRTRVLIMFLLEATVLGGLACSLGGVLGAAIAFAIDAAHINIPVAAVQLLLMSDVLRLVVDPVQVVMAVIGFTVAAGLAALWPAYRASRMEPVTAIHHVG
ncbi:MAG: FtsX-like permease family protein [Myxococcota bacterium]